MLTDNHHQEPVSANNIRNTRRKLYAEHASHSQQSTRT